jgi:catechol 2,3-dioxygenase-like lactoylglutathione lyase family enzyme
MDDAPLFTALNHVGLSVADIDRSVKFYTEFMGMTFDNIRYNVTAEYIRQVTGYPDGDMHVAFVTLPSLRLEIIQYVVPKGEPVKMAPHRPGQSHLCFATTDALKAYQMCLDQGITCINPPAYIDQGPSTGAIAFYLQDPDGYNLEIYQPAPKKTES